VIVRLVGLPVCAAMVAGCGIFGPNSSIDIEASNNHRSPTPGRTITSTSPKPTVRVLDR
jgi:hypothetical protein